MPEYWPDFISALKHAARPAPDHAKLESMRIHHLHKSLNLKIRTKMSALKHAARPALDHAKLESVRFYRWAFLELSILS
jgi:hypothetical protein